MTRQATRLLVFLASVAAIALPGRHTQAGVADAATPQAITVRTTLVCVGVKWEIEGDENRNAACSVRFRRKGTAEWREALPLFRVRHSSRKISVNALIGSIFHLAPGTTYEISLALTDADGGSAVRTVEATTRPLPRFPVGGRTIRVAPGELAAAEAKALPGDVLLLEKGDHGPGLAIKRPGAAGRYIVYRGPDDGEAVINGRVWLGADHVWLENVTVRMPAGGRGITGNKRARDVVVRRCRVEGAHYGVSAYGQDWFVSDCTIVGDKRGGGTGSHKSGEGVEFIGRGHVAAFNGISFVADGVSYGQGDIDVHNNAIHETVDDSIEPDYAFDNYRLWRNRCWATLNGLSFQPINGGPWYILNNQVTGTRIHTFKVRGGSGPRVVAGNTLVSSGYTMRLGLLFRQALWCNNVWVQLPKGRLGFGYVRDGALPWDGAKAESMDHNAYGTGGNPLWRFGKRYTLEMMQQAGFERHSIAVTAKEALTNLPADPAKGTSAVVTPAAGSKIIDAGRALPNVTGPYLGTAPDIGAHELGLGAAWVGPRTYTANGLAYGLPDGWEAVPVSKSGDYRALGAPAEVPGARLLLVREKPAVFILVTFEPAAGEARWQRLQQVLGDEGDPAVFFRDGLGARIRYRDASGHRLATLSGGRVEADGVLNVLAGCAETDLGTIRGDLFTFVRSLYY